MTAARHHGIAPEELAYRVHEKRHGFVRHARNVVIEVDPEAPRRPAGPAAKETAPAPDSGGAPAPARERRVSATEGRERRAPRGRREGGERGGAPAAAGSSGRRRRGARGGDAGESHEVWSDPDEESLVAISEAVRAVVALAGLELDVTVRAGEGRVDVELTGEAVGAVRARGLPLLEEMELLAPRAAHGLSGKMVRCRIDCDGLRAEREAALREIARRAAEEVARTGEASYTEPLPPGDRRIIHLELAESAQVDTESVGGGFEKRVRIAPHGEPS